MKNKSHILCPQSTKTLLVILGVIFFSVFLIGNVDASVLTTHSYKDSDMKVEFRTLGLIYQGDATLKSHSSVDEVLEFGYGKEEVVMYYDFNWNDLLENGLGEVSFTNERTGENIQKEYYFVEWVVRNVSINDYGWVDVGKNFNGSTNYEYQVIGNHLEERGSWKRLTNNDIPKGNTRIGIKTYVGVNDYIDAKWIISGDKISKHAVWSSSLEANLISWWTMNYSSGPINDSLGNATGTNNGADYGAVGIINDSLDFEFDDGDFVTVGNNAIFNFTGTTAFTVSAWILREAAHGNDFIFSHDIDPVQQYALGMTSNNKSWVELNGVGSEFNTTIQIGVFTHIVYVIDEQWVTVYINGTNDGGNVTRTSIQAGTTTTGRIGARAHSAAPDYFDGLIDEVAVWNRSLSAAEVENIYSGGNGCTFQRCIDVKPAPIVTVFSPTNTTFTDSTIFFNATSNQTITEYIVNYNGTNITSFTINTTLEVEDGKHQLFVYANGTDTPTKWGVNDTIFFAVDTGAPQITVNNPNNTFIFDFHEINTNITVNWTVTDTSLDTCTLEYNGVNRTVTCLDNTTQINATISSNSSLIFYVNDSIGNSNYSSVDWDYKLFQNSLLFNSTSIGGNTESFILNVTKINSLQISTVNLIYNNSASSASFTSGDISTVTSELIIPNPSTQTNFSFLFSFTMSDSSIANTSTNNQTIKSFDIGNCTEFSTLIYNFTMFNEVNLTKLVNVSIDYAFNLFDKSRTVSLVNASFNSTENPTAVCISQNLTSSSLYSLDAVLKYTSSDAIGYLTRYYNILNFSLTQSTIPQNVSIYSVTDDIATPFQLTFKDENLALAPNILVNVDKQFVASNDFKTVEIPITDTNGQTIINLERDIGIYNLIFIDIAGNIVATFNKITAFCQDFTIGECTLELDAQGAGVRAFNLTNATAISYTLAYTNSTSTATLTFSSLNSTPITARIIGTTNNQFGNRSVCDSSLTSVLGTVDCNVSSILLTDNYLFVDIFSNGKYVETRVININPAIPLMGGIFGSAGFFIAFLMMLSIIMLFTNDRQVLLIMVGLGWATVLIFGLVKGAIIGSVSGGIWLIITIAVMLWKLKEEDKGQ